jgi:hypothetical protein
MVSKGALVSGLVGILGLAVAVLALVRDVFDYKIPPSTSIPERVDSSVEAAVDTPESTVTDTSPTERPERTPPRARPPYVKPSRPAPSERPGRGSAPTRADGESDLKFTLSDGGSQLVASKRATVSVEFNRIGEEELMTLVIASDVESKTEAVLGPGKRVVFKAGGRTYHATVTGLDFSSRTAQLRVGPG